MKEVKEQTLQTAGGRAVWAVFSSCLPYGLASEAEAEQGRKRRK